MTQKEREQKLAQPVKPEEFTEYRAYVKSGYWEARKELYFERNPRECAVCGTKHVDLHHMFYGDYGQEPDEDLIPLCRRDHEALHIAMGGSWKDVRAATKQFVIHERNRLAPLSHKYSSEPKRTGGGVANFIERLANPIWRILRLFSNSRE